MGGDAVYQRVYGTCSYGSVDLRLDWVAVSLKGERNQAQ